MGAARRTGPRRALVLLPAVAVVICAALAGCGSTVAVKDAPAGMIVCAHAGDVDRLTIGRLNFFRKTMCISASRRRSPLPVSTGHKLPRERCARSR